MWNLNRGALLVQLYTVRLYGIAEKLWDSEAQNLGFLFVIGFFSRQVSPSKILFDFKKFEFWPFDYKIWIYLCGWFLGFQELGLFCVECIDFLGIMIWFSLSMWLWHGIVFWVSFGFVEFDCFSGQSLIVLSRGGKRRFWYKCLVTLFLFSVHCGLVCGCMFLIH